MDFLTLHELARQFNKPERVIRYKFHTLRKAGKLGDGDDFRKEDFVDELHFAYKINPLRFMEEAKLVLDQQVVNNIVNETPRADNSVGSESTEPGTNANNYDKADDSNGDEAGIKERDLASKSDNQPEQPGTSFVDNKEVAATNGVFLDYIETMKEQLRVKDGQIESYKKQLDDQSDLNRRSIGELLKMKDQVFGLKASVAAETEAGRGEPWSVESQDQRIEDKSNEEYSAENPEGMNRETSRARVDE